MNYLTFIFAITLTSALAQSETTGALKSCNVVCNCNSGQSRGTVDPPNRQVTNQGPTGKLGPKGDPGSVGVKGEKGDTGLNGQKGMKGEALSLSDVFQGLSATSCEDLFTRFHVSQSGFFPLRNPSMLSPVYRYCDFRRYTDVSSCEQLFQRYNLSIAGYYRFGRDRDLGTFRLCTGTIGPGKDIHHGVYTCQALRNLYPDLDVSKSGKYKFQSISAGAAYTVYCNFSQTPVATEVHHDLMEERPTQSSCEAAGCFIAAPSYQVNESSILEIIDNSVSCRQFVKVRCQGVVLGWQGSFNRGWWVARNGQQMNYWGGSMRDGYCGCGETGTCIDNSYKCNCDQNSETRIASDEGYLTDKTKLPLRQIQIGDMSGQNERAWFAIGKLECFGQV